MSSRLVVRLVLACASAACGLLVANAIVARCVPLPAWMYETDPLLLYRLKPGAVEVRTETRGAREDRIVTAVDGQGYRGDDVAASKTRPRLLVVGDSFVMATRVALADTFVEQLRDALRASAQGDLEAINAGVTGYGPDQECLKIERVLEPLAPDLVVVVLCAHNDFGDLVRDKLFRLDARGELVKNAWTLDPALAATFARYDRDAARPALVRALQDRFRAGEEPEEDVVRQPGKTWLATWLAGATEEYDEFALAHDDRVRTLFHDYYDADVALRPESDSATFKRRMMKAVLARLVGACARRQVPLAFVVVPSALDLCASFEAHDELEADPGWEATRLTGALSAMLSELGAPFVDLFQPFADAGPDALFFGPRDVHWTAAGQAIGARVTAKMLLERGLWPPRRGR